jgi:D-glycero-D-manno-heptose 1,7-bisphosphate phosphatase
VGARPAGFLDRDGTINRRPPPHEYVTRIEDFELLPGAVEGMAALAECGFVLVVVSNQRGMAHGVVTGELLDATESALQDALRPLGAQIAAFHYCPHELDEDCGCRKPAPGMLLQAARELDLDLGASWTIGDSQSDVDAGAAAGTRTVGLGSGLTGATLAADSLQRAAAAVCGAG